MDCKDIKMELLSKEEAWKLFLDIVRDDVLRTPGLKETAERVAEECACLPLAVITIGGSMKGVIDTCEWRHVLEKLKEYSAKGLKEMRLVLRQLKYSYSCLEDEVHRRCLLYCALYPEDFAIQRYKLIDLLIVEGIIDGMKSRQAQLDKGHSILNKLEKVCLLERAKSNKFYSLNRSPNSGEYVKMHDLIRDMALQIMGRGSMVEAGEGLRDLPDDEHWTEDLEWVSLMKNNISEIQYGASPRCGGLSTLFLSGNGLRRIADSFFVHMSRLKVLNLSYTDIEILPDKISDMVNLSALLLRRCFELKYVPSLAKLWALKALDLSYTGIEEVPQGLEMLESLNYLNLFMGSLGTFPTGILPRLSRLQYFIVDTRSDNSRVKGEDVASLTKLERFAGKFYNLHDFNIYVRSLQGRRLRDYSLQVGVLNKVWYLYAPLSKIELIQKKDEVDGHKYVGLGQCIISSRENPVVLPEDCYHLDIEKCHDMNSLSDVLLSKHDFLKRCYIYKCDGIECVISSLSSTCTPLRSLERLHLTHLRNLRTICQVEASPLPPATFSCLMELRTFGCPNMKKLFTPRLLPHLQNLELIHVRDCDGMKEIIAAADDEREGGGVGESSNRSIANNDDTTTRITLPKLRELTLFQLPNLTSIVSGKAVMVCNSLVELTVLCPKLNRLPLSLPMPNGQPSPPPSLERIILHEREWWESLEWDHPTAKDVLQPFIEFQLRPLV